MPRACAHAAEQATAPAAIKRMLFFFIFAPSGRIEGQSKR
jgi:hypothetical protein